MGLNLGSALTAIGFEGRFLSDGDISGFPLVERGEIVTSIIAERLRLGRWQEVINMMYGDSGNADVLYEGDRDDLREDILNSAIKHPKSGNFRREDFVALAKAGENDLLFRLAISIPFFSHDAFMGIVDHVDKSYFDGEEGGQRKQILHQTAAIKAMKEREYGSAFGHFTKVGDNDGIGDVFEAVLAIEDVHFHYSGELLEKIALSDPTQKNERLERIVLSSISGKKGGLRLRPLASFELFKKHEVELSPGDKETFQRKVVESASRYDVQKFSEDPEMGLLWAKKHAKDEPKTAYLIFTQQEFNGAQVIAAVRAGLELESYQNKERVLETQEVNEPHLRKAYKSASFDVKVRIASHLKDSKKLKELSRQAYRKSDLGRAYSLWVAGKGDLNGDYIGGIRTALITDGVKDNHGYMTFLDNSDSVGMAEAHDTLMKTDKGERTSNLGSAYEIALKLEDEGRTQRTREEIVAINPAWAVRSFTNETRGEDREGLNYVLGVVATEHGVNREDLRRLVAKYQTA